MTSGEATVRSGGRLHFGFRNLSGAGDRIFGSIGVGVTAPEVRVTATRAPDIACAHRVAAPIASRAALLLGVDGASIAVERELPRHVGLGSGTQLALATYCAIASVNGVRPRVREHAPALGRGRRSGIGIAAFERGGLVVDAGHPSAAVLAGPRPEGSWETPPVYRRVDVPASWRFVLVLPKTDQGKHQDEEAASMRRAIETADAASAREIESLLHDQVIPAVADSDIDAFGTAITRIDELNGAWFAEEQRARHRPPAGEIVTALYEQEAIYGVGQSSWGALVYGVTSGDLADAAYAAGRRALRKVDRDGKVWVVSARNHGATIIESDNGKRTMNATTHGVSKE